MAKTRLDPWGKDIGDECVIHELERGGFVIAQCQVWRPGSYATEDAARMAFAFTDETLIAVRDRVNCEEKRDITVEDLNSTK